MSTKPPEQKEKSLDFLVLSIATNHFTVPLPTGKEVIRAVNAHDALVDSAKLAVTVLRDSEADEWAKSHAIAALNKAIALTETEATK